MARKLEEQFEKLATNLLGFSLMREFKESEFESLCIRKMDGGLTVDVKGQYYGLVGALGTAVVNICKVANKPIDELLMEVTAFATVLRDNTKQGESPQEHTANIDESSLDELMSALGKMCDNKEGEQE